MPEKKTPTPEELARLLQLASKKLGTTPERLQSILADPQAANALLQKLGGEKAKKALRDPAVLQDLLNRDPQAKKLYDDLTGGTDDGG